MARFRLRFLLQELDLPRGVTVIGRSLECSLTIEDPLVSREHARIVIDDAGGVVEDLGSRNGVRVNGLPIRSPTPLRDGDRVRIGTQDFVFCRVDGTGRAHTKTTGVLRLCASCRLPYARELLACPSCGAIEQTEETTLAGPTEGDGQARWTVQLLVESIEHALTLARTQDAERIARRATVQVDELLASGRAVDPRMLSALAGHVLATAAVTHDPAWILWVLDVYRRTDRIPPTDVVDKLAEAVPDSSRTARAALDALLEHVRGSARSISAEELEALSCLEGVRLRLGP